MNRTSFILSAVVLIFCLNACGSTRKVNTELAGKYWKLVELNGNSVAAEQTIKAPHIVLDMSNYKFSGNAGCNTIVGSFQLGTPNKITFSQVIATRMMCLNMEMEDQLLKIFDAIDGYAIDGDTLIFMDASETPLARFTVHPFME